MGIESGDGCTYSCTNYIGVYADSKESLENEFFELVMGSLDNGVFTFHGEKFYTNNFVYYEHYDPQKRKMIHDSSRPEYYGPQFYTLDEFFESVKRVSH